MLAYVSAVLDSGYANLTAAGVDATMPVTLPSGYKVDGDYTTTANLALFNRGLAGEVLVERGFDHQNPCTACFATAITALNVALAGSGATPTGAQLAAGPYYEYNPCGPGVVLESARRHPHFRDEQLRQLDPVGRPSFVEDREGGGGIGERQRTAADVSAIRSPIRRSRPT